MTQQDTQPPAETLAEAREAAALAFDVRARKASHPEVATLERDHAKVIRAGEGDEYDAVQAAVIALTRRAGGDAIPAKEAFDAWRRAQPSGDERFPYDIAKAAFLAGRESATPKPPAGGEAGADAADILDHYARFIRDEVKADDLERHPYLPHIEQVAADLRAALALPAPVVEGVNDAD